MYESYPWPGANSIKTEIQLMISSFKSIFRFSLKNRLKNSYPVEVE